MRRECAWSWRSARAVAAVLLQLDRYLQSTCRWRANETPVIGLNPSPKLSAALWCGGALRLVVELADNVYY